LLPFYSQGCALRAKESVLAWPRRGHASTLSFVRATRLRVASISGRPCNLGEPKSPGL